MLDGAAKVGAMFEEATRLGMTAVGMTDHGNMYGASQFYNEAVKAGIKPIIGIEAYIAPESRFNTKRVLWGDRSQKSDDVSGSGAYTHMTMVAENATGLRNLFKLSSLASIEGQLGKWPRMDEELIASHAEGIIATTGCPSGEVQTRLRLGHEREALESAAKWREIFGADNYFRELMDHGLSLEQRVRDGLLDIGRKLGIPPLATNDCHYVTRDAAHNHEALLCVQTGKTLSDPNRFKFDGDGYYLKSAADMRQIWDDEVPGACDSTLLIAERVQSYDEVWAPRDRMPIFPVPEGHDQASWLHHEVLAGLQRRFPAGVGQDYIDRAEYEIKVICDKGFPSYFLIVADLINYARSVDIRVGPGRGSAAGSLVAYALGITNIDPIPHGLLFERFLNPERPSAPDIDIDFDDRRRGEMVRYAAEKWGSDRVAQVITFGTIKTKAALKDSARIHYGQPGFAIADRITKALPPPIMAKDIPLSGITDIDPIPGWSAVRAVPQPGTPVGARHRYRLRRPSARRDGALRRRQVGLRPRRPGHHLRHHQNQSGAEGLGAHPLRPARVRDRRPDHQGAAAADHGQGHSAVGHHRPGPRAVQGGRRGPRSDRKTFRCRASPTRATSGSRRPPRSAV